MIVQPTGYWTDVIPDDHVVCEEIVEYMKRFWDKDEPTYDFGCGAGGYLAKLEDARFDCLFGFEGNPKCATLFRGWVEEHDLTAWLPCDENEEGNVLCLEVAEHIPPEHTGVFLDTLVDHCKKHMILSWAVRGQPGDGHVNCLDNLEAVALLEERGMHLDANMTSYIRAKINGNPTHWQGADWKPVFRGHFQNTVMVFKRAESGAW